MAKPAVTCDVFRGLFAFYGAKADLDHKDDGDHYFVTLFGSAEPRARRATSGDAPYDHASDFLHALLRDLDRKLQ